MGRKRKRIAKGTETSILISCGRRCCLCWLWDNDDSQKEGQIAHIDRDPSNASEDNLVYLCLEHHNQYDARQAQAKDITPDEVRRARDELLQHLDGPGVLSISITLRLAHDFDGFTNEDARKVVAFVEQICRPSSKIKLVAQAVGSVLLTIRVDVEAGLRLMEALDAGELKQSGVVDGWVSKCHGNEDDVRIGPATDSPPPGSQGRTRSQREPATGAASQEAESLLGATMIAIGATSCTFYVRDPIWNDPRLVLMPGVQHQEPMYGLMLPSGPKERVSKGGPVEYISDARSGEKSWIVRDELNPVLQGLIADNPIFGDFVERERVTSCARLLHYEGELAQATLFVNFTEHRRFEDEPEICGQIETLFGSLTALLPGLRNELLDEDQSALGRLAKILRSVEELAALGHRRTDGPHGTPLRTFFESILRAAMEAFEIDLKEGLGTIHRYRPETGVLEPCACIGTTETAPPPKHQVASGHGIITWIAAKRRALLISDLQKESAFRGIFLPLREGIRSAMAVPMLADGELLGVLNLESIRENAFSPCDVRALWYAANHAAIAYQFFQEASARNQLARGMRQVLNISHQAATLQRTEPMVGIGRQTLDLFAQLFQSWTCSPDWQQADWCDLWKWDAAEGEFTEAGATYRELESIPVPREQGWTKYVRDIQKPIWIGDIRNVSDFEVWVWEASERRWRAIERHAEQSPGNCNDRLASLGVSCELGLPFRTEDRGVVAVGWAKYHQPIDDLPNLEIMEAMQWLGESMGLAADSVHEYSKQRERAEEGLRHEIKAIVKRVFPPPRDIPGIEVAVESHPYSASIGGDVYTFVQKNTDHVMILGLLGDAENHGIPGALRAIPVFAVFRNFSQQVFTPVALLQKMREVAQDLKINATALSFLIDLDPVKPRLFASSAGHPPLIVMSQGGANTDVPDLHSPAFTGNFWGDQDEIEPSFLCDEWKKLESGDVIIGYSDGISEAGANNDFGRESIISAALPLARPSAEIAKDIYEAAKKHQGGTHLEDDATVIVMKLKQDWVAEVKSEVVATKQPS
ncbi:MAG: SpoIIE family protein phosphatase [Planctomycetes bacterium]|nr:SpoIIE family protein phosphatase [Planctomycetota bacterium]